MDPRRARERDGCTVNPPDGGLPREHPFRVAYVLWKFPRFSETFVANELFFLRQAAPGLQVRVFAVRKGDAGAESSRVAALRPSLTYLPALWAPCSWWWMVHAVWGAPRAVAKTLVALLRLSAQQPSHRTRLYAMAQSLYALSKGLPLAVLLRREQVAHAHAHFAETGGLVAWVAARVAGIPFSVTLHGHDIFFNPNPLLAAFLIRESCFAITVSEYNRRFLARMEPAAQSKVRVVHCGVDLALFHPGEPRTIGVFRILTVARLQPRKGIADLVEACRALADEVDYECVVVGDGPQRTELEDKAARYGLGERFRFLGARAHEEVLAQLQETSVFVLPSYSEGVPVSVMEAMAMGVPVIATAVNGVPELVKRGAGILVAPGNIDALAAALRRVANMSDAERRRMGRKARQVVEREFDIRTQSAALARMFLSSSSEVQARG
ncbi:MAG: glycosyltransferase [candidate division KSB1 bacterium]|nr:glycosyltransferase [candidate division KSB1 bacterium]